MRQGESAAARVAERNGLVQIAEYVLIGTLWSFGLALAISLAAARAIENVV